MSPATPTPTATGAASRRASTSPTSRASCGASRPAARERASRPGLLAVLGLPIRPLPHPLFQDLLAEADRPGRDLHQLILLDVLDGLFQGHLARGLEGDRGLLSRG